LTAAQQPERKTERQRPAGALEPVNQEPAFVMPTEVGQHGSALYPAAEVVK
jgi:hypothetical protein